MVGIPYNTYTPPAPPSNIRAMAGNPAINPIVQQMIDQGLMPNPVSPMTPPDVMNSLVGQAMQEEQQQPQQLPAPIDPGVMTSPPPQQQALAPAPMEQVFAASAPAAEDEGFDEPSDDGLFSFMGKPGASDAMVAFGASMLKAPDFNTGLANGALAVNQVAREQRMPTKQEMARAALKGRMARTAAGYGGKSYQKGETYLGPDGVTTFKEVFDPEFGYLYQNSNTGDHIKALPPGSIRIQNSGIGEDKKNDYKALEEARVAANVAYEQENQFKALEGYIPTAGVEQGLLAQTKRELTKLIGREVFDGYNPADMTTVTKTLSDFELGLAQTQKGLGQFTEMERMIVREALPMLDSDPIAFKRVLNVMAAKARRAQMTYNEWMEMEPSERAEYGSFRKFQKEYKEKNDKQWDADLAQTYGIDLNAPSAGAPARPSSTAPAVGSRPGDKYLQ